MAGEGALRLAANCFLRSGPGPAYEAVGLGKRGAVLGHAGSAAKNGWRPVAWRGGVAWVAGRFIDEERG